MKEKQKVIREQIRSLAKKNNLTEKQVDDIEDSVWALVKKQIQESDYEEEKYSNIYIRFLGTIFVAPGRIKKIKEKINNGNNS